MATKAPKKRSSPVINKTRHLLERIDKHEDLVRRQLDAMSTSSSCTVSR